MGREMDLEVGSRWRAYWLKRSIVLAILVAFLDWVSSFGSELFMVWMGLVREGVDIRRDFSYRELKLQAMLLMPVDILTSISHNTNESEDWRCYGVVVVLRCVFRELTSWPDRDRKAVAECLLTIMNHHYYDRYRLL